MTKEELSDTTRKGYDCRLDPNVVVNWEGDCVATNQPWYDKSLFKVQDFSFTIGDAVVSTVVIIVLGVIAFLISSYIAWRKRKAIAAGARRMSASIKRASLRLRDSIRGASNKVEIGEASSDDDNSKFGLSNNIVANKD